MRKRNGSEEKQALINCKRKCPENEMILTYVAVTDEVLYSDKPSPVPQSRGPTFCKGSLTPARFQYKSAIQT
jgi:hypothetical protein